MLFILDNNTGKQISVLPFPEGIVSLMAHDGAVYIGTGDGKVSAYMLQDDRDGGRPKTLLYRPLPTGRQNCGNLYFVTEKNLHKIGRKSG